MAEVEEVAVAEEAIVVIKVLRVVVGEDESSLGR